MLWIVIVGFVIGFGLAFNIGANDAASSFGTSVGSKVLTLRKAFILATIFETAGCVLVGGKVSGTISKGIVDISMYTNDLQLLRFGYLSSLLGASIWLLLATVLKLPVSGTHSIVGAVVGFSLVCKGFLGVHWIVLAKIAVSWVASPLLSGAASVAIYKFICSTILPSKDPEKQLNRGIMLLPLFYSFTFAVNCFSVVFHGPEILHFHIIPWWGALILSLGVGLITAAVVRFCIGPRLMQKFAKRNLSKEQTENSTSDVDSFIVHAIEDMNEDSLPRPKRRNSISRDSTRRRSSAEGSVTGNQTLKPVEGGSDVLKLFAFLQVLTACFGAFAHGGNDVSNAVGPVVGLYQLHGADKIPPAAQPEWWILFLGGVAISVGLWVLGKRVIETLGEDLTEITPISGFTIEIGAATTVLVASQIGIPVSTTHCKVGSVVFVGLSNGSGKVSWRIFGSIVLAWFVTVPASAGFSAAIMATLRAVADSIFPELLSNTLNSSVANTTLSI